MTTTTASPDPETTLAEWRAAEAAARTRLRGFGQATPEQIAGKSGLEVMRGLLAGELPAPPISETLDFVLVEVDRGRALFQGRPQLKHYNPLGGVHGGWFATLLDSCMGCAVHTTMPPGRAYTTAELKINIVRPLSDRVPFVRAEGRVIHEGRRMSTADGRLFGADGKLYAHGSTTCFVYEAAER